jgi:D-amino-acid dehydrogenase
MKVVVVGAGIVGLATAYELAMAGHTVTVIEATKNVGQGASGGNGAQLSYSYVQPLADPAIWAQLPKLLLKKDSPVAFSPNFSAHQWRWLFAFMKACTKTQSQQGTRILLELGAISRQRFEAMKIELKILSSDCDYQENGKLVLYRSQQSFELALKHLAYQKSLGVGGEQFAITGKQVAILEPALTGTENNIVGAIHTPSECVVNTQKLCDVLSNRLRSLGVSFAMEQTVSDLPRRVANEPDTQWVICAGAQSYEMLKAFGLQVPVYPIKGYSITMPWRLDQLPKLSITDSAIKTVFAPLADPENPTIRVAGFAEFVGMNREVDQRKIQILVAATKNSFPSLSFNSELPLSHISPWTGLRPATPSGIPMVGRLVGLPKNLWVNIGHGALGLTLAFGTAFDLCHRMGSSVSMNKLGAPL